MSELTIRIGAKTPELRAELRAEVEGALLGEERERAVLSETNDLRRPKGELEPALVAADWKSAMADAGAFILISGAPGSGKSTIAARILTRFRRVQRQHVPVLTRVA
jgi:superfamily II DNA or RNA helicase